MRGNVLVAKLAGIEWGPSCVGMTKMRERIAGRKIIVF
jgi:hypothetical protein